MLFKWAVYITNFYEKKNARKTLNYKLHDPTY